jgi:hypothetical protein
MPGKMKKAVRLVKRRPGFSSQTLKIADSKGRIVLGPNVANQSVQVEERGVGEWTVRLVEPVPIKEAWLFKNPRALRRVQKGFQQAQNREFALDPREGQDYSWVDEVDEENV